ncbi:bifunctional 2-dehydro-3-deoxygluconokinase/2-dehydro-3-deoxygalactonokinase [Haloarcula amylovorans]|uniref:bifunctional 2-dehydro-3-deoxygluconokinase/2-dehydro-3- deoxygalactonokinase n=1 Tax=Haloarcula amylovorans TaxID=2562280 RepID=UPI001076A10F|nr:bifunctional 2-dehydro-3-deoxygluconokinase/2-dehydro-3-deoxygalactonokinase [Halomicroarcula amylolytica]
MTDLVAFGETMLRLSPPDEERLETADQYNVRAAGAESNVAVAAQRLGLDAVWTSKLPDSPVGRRVVGELRNHGVTTDIAWDDSEKGRQGTYYLEQGQPPRGNEVIYDRADASVTTARTAELPTERIAAATGFHTTGITPALSETLEGTTTDLLSLAQDADTVTSFDLNYRSKLWEPAEAKAILTDLFPDVDVLVVAQRDAEVVLDRHGDAEAVARGLAEDYGFDVTLVTRGAEGALALTDGTIYEQPTYEASNAYPVGTGDSFVGGFLSQYLAGEAVPDALEWGAATAALKRSVPGDIAVVSPDEVREVIAGDTRAISR